MYLFITYLVLLFAPMICISSLCVSSNSVIPVTPLKDDFEDGTCGGGHSECVDIVLRYNAGSGALFEF